MSKRWGTFGLSVLVLLIGGFASSGCGNSGSGNIVISVPSGLDETAGTVSGGGTVIVPKVSGFDQIVTLDVVCSPAGGEGKLIIPGSVTVPAGATSVSFDIEVVDNSTSDGDFTYTITASCDPYTPGNDTILVTDDD